MSKLYYRPSFRLDLGNEKERKVAEYLQKLNSKGGRKINNFIVAAVDSAIKRENSYYDFTLDDIREVIHDELGRCYFVRSDGNTEALPFTPDDNDISQEDLDASILDALEAFGC